MPQPDQTLPSPDDKLRILERWFEHQGVVDEVFAEREAQHDQWDGALPPLAIVEHFQGLSRDELIQALAAGFKMVTDLDQAATGASGG